MEQIKPALFFIGGITGSGKSSVTRELAINDERITPIYGSQALMNHFNCHDQLDLGRISDKQQEKGRIEIFSKLSSLESTIAILDGHFVLFTKNGVKSVIEKEWIKNFKSLIYLKSSPNSILERLTSDRTNLPRRLKNLIRKDCSLLERIKQSQDISINFAKRISKDNKIPLRFVDNSTDLASVINKVEKIIFS